MKSPLDNYLYYAYILGHRLGLVDYVAGEFRVEDDAHLLREDDEHVVAVEQRRGVFLLNVVARLDQDHRVAGSDQLCIGQRGVLLRHRLKPLTSLQRQCYWLRLLILRLLILLLSES